MDARSGAKNQPCCPTRAATSWINSRVRGMTDPGEGTPNCRLRSHIWWCVFFSNDEMLCPVNGSQTMDLSVRDLGALLCTAVVAAAASILFVYTHTHIRRRVTHTAGGRGREEMYRGKTVGSKKQIKAK